MARAVATRRAVVRGFNFKLLGRQHAVPLATSQKQFPSILRCVLREGLPSFTTCDLRGTHRQLACNLRGNPPSNFHNKFSKKNLKSQYTISNLRGKTCTLAGKLRGTCVGSCNTPRKVTLLETRRQGPLDRLSHIAAGVPVADQQPSMTMTCLLG